MVAAAMNESLATIEEILADAVEITAADQRRAFVAAACAGQTDLQREVERLIDLHFRSGSFLEDPAADLALELTLGPGELDTHKDSAQPPISLSFLDPPGRSGSLGRIGPYDVDSALGRGGMGIVLKAFDQRLQRSVAVKVLAPELAADPIARKRFLREGRAAAAIAHPNVVTIYSVDDGPLPYLVMEYIDGMSLRDVLECIGPLRPEEIVRIGTQVASGLAAAHERGLIHRDIKPANILLSVVSGQLSVGSAASPRSTDNCQLTTVKLTDFGLARAVDDLELTQAGQVAGTPQYMSPEQAQPLPLDARSDLFSLGSVLYAMCTGRSPFRAEGTLAVLRRVCDEPHQPANELNPNVPDWLSALIDRLLAKRPEDRVQSAHEVAELLSAGRASRLPESSPHAPREVPIAQSASPPLRGRQFTRRWPIIATGFAGFLLASLGVWVSIKDKQGREVARVEVPDGGSVAVETTSPPTIGKSESSTVELTAERMAFVLLGGQGVNDRRFDTLLEAIEASSDGDKIEIRGNGPFVTNTVFINHGITIRAGGGYRPVLKLNPTLSDHRADLLQCGTGVRLALEGLELWGTRLRGANPGAWTVVVMGGEPLQMANCRIVTNGSDRSIETVGQTALLNCEFLALSEDLGVSNPGLSLSIDNSILVSQPINIGHWRPDWAAVHVRITRSTMAAPFSIFPIRVARPARLDDSPDTPPLEFHVSATVIQSQGRLFAFYRIQEQDEPPRRLTSVEAKKMLPFIRWQGNSNAYAFKLGFLDGDAADPAAPRAVALNDWRSLSGSAETASAEGLVKFVGGDVIQRSRSAPDKLTADDFRLRPDSAGYRAGPGGKDLGADLEFVGPGAAYERWKKTPAYQEWLKETGQEEK